MTEIAFSGVRVRYDSDQGVTTNCLRRATRRSSADTGADRDEIAQRHGGDWQARIADESNPHVGSKRIHAVRSLLRPRRRGSPKAGIEPQG